QLAAARYLRVCQASIPPMSTKTRISLVLIRLHATKERFECQVNPYRDILQRLGVDLSQLRTDRFEDGQPRSLIVIAQRLLALFPRITAFGQQMIVEPAALLKLLFKEALLLLVRVQTILEHLKNTHISCLEQASCQERGPFTPLPE